MYVKKKIKVIGILYRLKDAFPEYVLFTLYNSLIVSYINYGYFCGELTAISCNHCKRKQYAS